MTTVKPTVVLIHGAYHTPRSYEKLTTALRKAGYEVHVPSLLSTNGARPPNADLIADTQLIRGYVESLIEAGRSVIAIAHSYGGQVATNALHSLKGVVHILYLAAFVFPEGKMLVQIYKDFGDEEATGKKFEVAPDGSVFPLDPASLFLGPGVDAPEAEAYVSTLVRWNAACMGQPLTGCAWKTIPATYIQTTSDSSVPIEYQRSMVERVQQDREMDVVVLDTGHSPHVTKTEEVVNTVNKIVDQLK